MEKRSFSIYVSEDIINKIKEKAVSENRSLSNFIENIFKDFIEKEEKEKIVW